MKSWDEKSKGNSSTLLLTLEMNFPTGLSSTCKASTQEYMVEKASQTKEQ